VTDFSFTITIEEANDCPSEERVLDLVDAVFEGESISWAAISIVLTDHDTVLDLNREWLQHDYTTDVISFLLEDDPEALEGEVYVDIETARERHEEFSTSARSEIERYIVHGLLHLAGYDDASDEDRAVMHHLENKYLELA
jgi:probable rRNA maturation factor